MMELPKTPSFRLDGKRALVAGASKGIGLACAVALAEAGAHVICAARGKTELEHAVAAMAAQKLSAEALVLDITDLAALEAAFVKIGRLDIFVNSAGTARHSQAIDTKVADYDAVMGLNLRAAYFASAWAAKAMLAGKAQGQTSGSIINISSQMGHVGGIDRGVYAASKHALEGMTKSMAIEWGPHNIRINTIGPTFIRTELGEQTLKNPERRAWILSKIKLGRVGEVEDIMGAVVFLASPAAALITGTALLIDGGWTAG
jgi:NAD(P)-dependent dehydrogenase (short-subunit alcohol dehydrogenase family)